MLIRLAFSPCPNDTFMFYALVHHKIDTEGFTFDLEIEDIHELNQRANGNSVDMIKVSCNTLGLLHPNYYLLTSGAAMGRGCGPLLMGLKGDTDWKRGPVGIPGNMTTANLLLSYRWPDIRKRKELLFSEILEAIESGEISGGLLIHEQRFTWQKRNVECIADLGAWWESQTGLPIPLGAIIVSKRLDPYIAKRLEVLLKKSVQWAFDHIEETLPYVKAHARELETSVMKAHIDLYVNDYSLAIGDEGMHAIRTLLSVGAGLGFYPEIPMEKNLLIP